MRCESSRISWCNSRIPVGLQIVGGWRADATVLRAAAAYEELRPWLDLLRETSPAPPDRAGGDPTPMAPR